MSLDLDSAKTELEKFCNPNSSSYLGDVKSLEEGRLRAKEGWANVLEKCALNINPASSTVSAAKAAFLASAGDGDLNISLFGTASGEFASVLALGMAGYSSIPPPFPFTPTYSGSMDYVNVIQSLAEQLVAWLSTGTATLVSPPGTTEYWS